MKYKSKYILYILLGLLLIGITFFSVRYLINRSSGNEVVNSNSETQSNSEIDFLLDTYPIQQVPLYKVTKVSSSKLYNNWDSRNTSIFDDKEFSYYNVVLYTDANQEEFLNYYKELFDKEIIDEYPMPDMVLGYIGKYRVSASHYGSDNTGYIQVYLPEGEVSRENIYFDTYPNLFQEDSMFVEEENSYGLLNQVGGQTEYTKYYTVKDSGDMNNDGIDDVDEFEVLISKYKELYKGKDSYAYNTESNLLTWKEDGYSVTVSFPKSHGRVYLNIRGSVK